MYLNVQESKALKFFKFVTVEYKNPENKPRQYMQCKIDNCTTGWRTEGADLLVLLSKAVTHIEKHEPEDPKPKKTDPKSDAIDEKETTTP